MIRSWGRAMLWLAASAWLALCFALSWQTGEETAGTSWKLADLLLRMLAPLGIKPDADAFHRALRTAAHFGMFLIAGTLFEAAFTTSVNMAKKAFLYALILCWFSAAACEIGKLWIPGRHLEWDELGLNLFGALCGILSLHLVVQRFRRPAPHPER